jgi:hypothetical protein
MLNSQFGSMSTILHFLMSWFSAQNLSSGWVYLIILVFSSRTSLRCKKNSKWRSRVPYISGSKHRKPHISSWLSPLHQVQNSEWRSRVACCTPLDISVKSRLANDMKHNFALPDLWRTCIYITMFCNVDVTGIYVIVFYSGISLILNSCLIPPFLSNSFNHKKNIYQNSNCR